MSWTTTRLGDVVPIGRPRPRELRDSESLVSLVPMAAVEEESGVMNALATISHKEAQKKTLTYFKDGDILFAKVTPCMENGKIAIANNLVGGQGYGSTEFHVLTPSEKIDANWLFLYLVQRYFRATAQMAMTGAVGLRRVPKSFLEEHLISLPPLDEQRRIVAELEEQLGHLEATRTRLVKTRSELLNLRASALNNHFGDPSFYENDESVPLGEILQPILGKRKTQRGWSPQCESYPAVDGEWGVLKTTAVQMGWYEPGQNKALPSQVEPRPGVEVQVGDLLLLTTGPRNRCGIPALVEETPRNLMMSGKMIRLRADRTRVLSEWLLLFFLSPRGQSELERLKVGSSDSSVSIGADVLLRIQIPGLALDEQEQFVTEMSNLAEAERRVEKLLRQVEGQMETARSSILHRAFSLPREDS